MDSWYNNQDQLCGISWGNGLEKAVGMFIGNGDYVEANWKAVLSKFEKVHSEYQQRSLLMKGKAVIANTLAPSKVFYVGYSSYMPKIFLQHFNSALFKFIWGNKPEAVARNTLYNKCIDGGIGLCSIKTKLQALHVMHLKNFIFGSGAKWSFFVHYWIGIYLGKFNMDCDTNSGPHASPDKIPCFYKNALDSLMLLFKLDLDFDLKVATSKTVYWTLIKQDLKIPIVEARFPLISFKQSWQNLDNLFIDSELRDTSWRICHQVLPVNEFLFFKGISHILKCFLCHNCKMFYHLFFECMVVKPIFQWLEVIIGQMLNHNYKLNIQAVLFCDIVPTGYKDSDSIILYLICLAKKIIWLE